MWQVLEENTEESFENIMTIITESKYWNTPKLSNAIK